MAFSISHRFTCHAPAVISYLASFALVKYNKISVPFSEETSTASRTQSPQPGRRTTTRARQGSTRIPRPDLPIQSHHIRATTTSDPIITIERVHLRNFLRTGPPASLLYTSASKRETVSTLELQDAHAMLLRCNSVCMILMFIGLSLAITGIMAYVWTTFTLAPSTFISACFITSLIGGCYALR